MAIETAGETIDRLKIRIEDPGESYFDPEDFVRVYNDALDEISDITEINESNVYIKRRKEATYIDLRGIVSPDFLRVTAIWNPTSEKWLQPTTPRELDETVGRFWEKRIDQTRWWFMRGIWHLGCYPTARDDENYPLKIFYCSLAPHIESTGGQLDGLSYRPPFPPDYADMIQDFMLYELLSERRETEKSMKFYERFRVAVEGVKTQGKNRMRTDRVAKVGARR